MFPLFISANEVDERFLDLRKRDVITPAPILDSPFSKIILFCPGTKFYLQYTRLFPYSPVEEYKVLIRVYETFSLPSTERIRVMSVKLNLH